MQPSVAGHDSQPTKQIQSNSDTTTNQQEDNLQHLALFSEYGRIALAGARKKPKRTPQSSREGTPVKELPPQAQQTPPKPTSLKPGTPLSPAAEEEEDDDDDDAMLLPEDEIPFQRIEFLVRDWMDFEEELPFHKLKQEMDAYLQEVIEKGGAKDLKHTRDQILSCFQKVRPLVWTQPDGRKRVMRPSRVLTLSHDTL